MERKLLLDLMLSVIVIPMAHPFCILRVSRIAFADVRCNMKQIKAATDNTYTRRDKFITTQNAGSAH